MPASLMSSIIRLYTMHIYIYILIDLKYSKYDDDNTNARAVPLFVQRERVDSWRRVRMRMIVGPPAYLTAVSFPRASGCRSRSAAVVATSSTTYERLPRNPENSRTTLFRFSRARKSREHGTDGVLQAV